MADDDVKGSANDPEHYKQSATDRAHGTHGKGDARETRLDDALVQPANERKADVGTASDANWGDAGAGGSVIDKLPQKHRNKPESEQGPAKGS